MLQICVRCATCVSSCSRSQSASPSFGKTAAARRTTDSARASKILLPVSRSTHTQTNAPGIFGGRRPPKMIIPQREASTLSQGFRKDEKIPRKKCYRLVSETSITLCFTSADLFKEFLFSARSYWNSAANLLDKIIVNSLAFSLSLSFMAEAARAKKREERTLLELKGGRAVAL